MARLIWTEPALQDLDAIAEYIALDNPRSEARQKLAAVVNAAEASDKVLIRRKDGRTFALTPERLPASPPDVPSVKADLTTKGIISIVREGRRRTRQPTRNARPKRRR